MSENTSFFLARNTTNGARYSMGLGWLLQQQGTTTTVTRARSAHLHGKEMWKSEKHAKEVL